MKHGFILLLLALPLALSCSTTPANRVALDSFQLTTLQGEAIDMNAFRGKTVFINVWATWCRPCVQEMPTIASAMEKLKDSNIVFLFASSEELEEITAFRDHRSFPFNYVQLHNLEALSIDALPATFIFDPSGELVFGEQGFRNWDTPDNLSLITQKQ